MSSATEVRVAPRITLDHNCIITLEQHQADEEALRELIALSAGGRCRLCVVAIGGSERLSDGSYADSFLDFRNKLTAVGLGDAEILSSMGYMGLSFFGLALFVGDDMLDLERRIHDILSPSIEFDFAAYCAARGLDLERDWGTDKARKWRNAKCDTLALWSHIWHRGDIFVTSDGNFHKATKKPKLIALSAGSILRPGEAVQTLQRRR